MKDMAMEKALKIEEDLGTDRELLMLNDIHDWHGRSDGTHILDICGTEKKFKNIVSIFFEYAWKHRIEFSATYSNGVGQIRLEKKRWFMNGAILQIQQW
jgi:hypothetical protein